MRKADIVKLMHMLSKDQRVKAYEELVARARMTFRLPKVTVSSLAEFIDTCALFCAHCARELTPTADPTLKWSRNAAVTILTECYPGGVVAAYTKSEEGTDGGIRAVLDAISDVIQERKADEYFEYALHECVDTMDPEDVTDLSDQFWNRCIASSELHRDFPTPQSLLPVLFPAIRAYVRRVSRIERSFGAFPGWSAAPRYEAQASRPETICGHIDSRGPERGAGT